MAHYNWKSIIHLLKWSFITFVLHVCFTVDKNGDVCISILHEPGEDKYGYEKAEERWLPIHTVETIMISVISMLADPNGDSPANVDAAVSTRCVTAHFYMDNGIIIGQLTPFLGIRRWFPVDYVDYFDSPILSRYRKNGGRTDMENSRGKLHVVCERAKRLRLSDTKQCSSIRFSG